MTAPVEGPEGREAELAGVFKRMGRAARRGDGAEFERLSGVYAELKAAHARLSREERLAEVRARRVAVRAREAREARVWRLPRGFGSPLAQVRDRTGVRPREEPRHPGYGLRPWRGGSGMSEVIWRPGG